jgi:hypothetical protein
MNDSRIIAACIIFLSLCAGARAQTAGRVHILQDPESLRRMLARQPNYTAMQQFLFSEGFGGFGANSKVAKMGNRQVAVTEDTIFISESGKPTIKVFPKRKEYAEMPFEKGDDFAVSPEGLAARSDVSFKSLGREKVGKYTCIKIEATYKDKKLKEMKFLFWAAPELKNLVIRTEISLGRQVRFLTLLEDISLSVDEELLRVPAGYKKIVEPDYMRELEEKTRKPR